LGRRAEGRSPRPQGVESVHRSWAALPAEPEDLKTPTSSIPSAFACSRKSKPEISGQKHPGGSKFRTFSINRLHQHFRPAEESSPAIRVYWCPFVVPGSATKAEQTERKGREVEKSTVVHQRITKSQNRTSFDSAGGLVNG
jgi:hypothetical protein